MIDDAYSRRQEELANLDSRGHTWKQNEDGTIDDFALEEGFHNGPQCVTCGYCYCEHCHRDGPQEDCEEPMLELKARPATVLALPIAKPDP